MKTKTIHIDQNYCVRCEDLFTGSGEKMKTKHHVVPKFLKPKSNYTICLCKDCHEELNKNYVSVAPKSKKLPKLKTIQNKVNGLKGALEKYGKKLEKTIKEIDKEIEDESPKEIKHEKGAPPIC